MAVPRDTWYMIGSALVTRPHERDLKVPCRRRENAKRLANEPNLRISSLSHTHLFDGRERDGQRSKGRGGCSADHNR